LNGINALPVCSVQREGRTLDDRQFDKWTRLLAGISRRDAAKLLAAGLIAGPVAVAGGRRVTAQVDAERCGRDGDRCNDNGDCCNDFKCKNDRCRNKDNNDNCGRDGDRCNDNGDCCSNFRCKNDRCRDKDNNNDRCGKQGDRCNNSGDCCSNFRCKNDKCRQR
jgi:hypothetical protein